MSKISDNIWILNENQETVGVATNGSPFSLPYYKDLHIENLQGISTYEFTVPATHPEASKLTINGHVLRQVYDGTMRLFTIRELSVGHSEGNPEMSIFAENTAIGELLKDIKRPSKHVSVPLETIVNDIVANTHDWTVGVMEYATARDIEFKDYMTVLEALKHVELEFNVEIYFTVDLENNQIKNKKVNVVVQRGVDNGVRFEYGHNLNGVGRSEDSTGLITAIIAVGKGDSDKERINLTKVPAFDDGDFYKLDGADWIGSEEALQRWSKDGTHIFGIHFEDEANNAVWLKQQAINELKRRCKPILIYSASVKRLEELTGVTGKEVLLGDTVTVLDKVFTPPLSVNGRVQGLEISYTDETAGKIDLGNYKPIALTVPPEIKRIQQAISLKEEEWNMSGITVEIESLGGNVFRNGVGSTNLKAKVFEKAIETDLDGTIYLYKWFKFNADGSRVLQWGDGTDYRSGKQISITHLDVEDKATFVVELEKIEI